jgi:hypothetical protein
MSSAKQRLDNLEREERYVFHGSGLLLEELEPRQAYTLVNGRNAKDGEPAVFASTSADYAIFMALINPTNCSISARSRVSFEDGELKFSATQSTIQQLNESFRGHVHVFNRSDFKLRGGNEWICMKPVKPVFIIEIGLSDFQREIQLIDSQDIEPGGIVS